jgi:peptidyl-prolyl cis-trans isomerase A (cyclophilin A)
MLAKFLPLTAFRACLALSVVALSFSSGQPAQAGTLITISTNMGDIKVDLFNDVVNGTVNNLLTLTDAGRYTNTLIHRSPAQDFVIQGGGFAASNYAAIPNNGTIPLQYQIKNTRGTIAMARGGAPNTATSQWFINTIDNSTGLGPGGFSADGYTVFGWVVSGMDVVDAIEDLPTYNMAGSTRTNVSAMNEMPLRNYTQANYNANVPITDTHKVIVNGISRVEDHPSFQNPVWNVDANNSGTVSTSDVMVIVNSILNHGRRHTADATRIEDTYQYFDTNGDNFVSTSDLMMVVNAILRGDTAPANPLAAMADPMAAPLAVVPEPSSLVMGILGGLALGTLALRRRRALRRAAAPAA